MNIKKRLENFDKKIETSFDLVAEAKLQQLKQSKEDLENYLKIVDKKELKEGLAIFKKV